MKLDLSSDEVIVRQPILRPIYHPYSDFQDVQHNIQSYCIEEIFSEKLRALTQRMRPRDLYDVIHLYNDKRWPLDRDIVLMALKEKCKFKQIELPSMELFDGSEKKQDLIVDWDNMLSHQIANLKSCEYYWKQLPEIFSWLFE